MAQEGSTFSVEFQCGSRQLWTLLLPPPAAWQAAIAPNPQLLHFVQSHLDRLTDTGHQPEFLTEWGDARLVDIVERTDVGTSGVTIYLKSPTIPGTVTAESANKSTDCEIYPTETETTQSIVEGRFQTAVETTQTTGTQPQKNFKMNRQNNSEHLPERPRSSRPRSRSTSQRRMDTSPERLFHQVGDRPFGSTETLGPKSLEGDCIRGTVLRSESVGRSRDHSVQNGRNAFATPTTPVIDDALNSQSPRQTILNAVELLESENQELKKYNSQILTEVAILRQENDKLRSDMCIKIEAIETQNRTLKEEIEAQNMNLKIEREKWTRLQNTLRQDNSKISRELSSCTQELKRTKNIVLQKENEAKTLNRELTELSRRLEHTSRKNFSEREIELLNEIEVLRGESKDLAMSKDELEKTRQKMEIEMKNLQTQLDDKIAELKNENRRHSLLTKEFNSLLNENNHLKLQLRRRKPITGNTLSSVQPNERGLSQTVLTLDRSITSIRGQSILRGQTPKEAKRLTTPGSEIVNADSKGTSESLPSLSSKQRQNPWSR